MSQTDVETLRTGYEAFNREDWDAVFESAAPDFELITADRVTNPGTYRGREEATQFFQDLFEPFEEVTVEPERFVENGDQIVVLVLVSSRPSGSTAVVENRIGHLWTMRDGKAVRFQIFPERAKALEAIGIEEQAN
jgi:ketosteroid isomerase-like protein